MSFGGRFGCRGVNKISSEQNSVKIIRQRENQKEWMRSRYIQIKNPSSFPLAFRWLSVGFALR
jgi:hypothetical protein